MFSSWHVILIVKNFAFEQDIKPTGDVSSVCWSLMGAIVVGAGIVIKWLVGALADEKKERKEDREKFETQTNALVNTILAKKKGESP